MKTDKHNSTDLKFTAWVVYGIVFIWFAFALLMGVEHRFDAGPNKPPLAFGLTLLAPIVFFVAAYQRRGAIWQFCQSLDLRFVVAVHFWRVMALDFLLCAASGTLPIGFALPAGLGDILTGLAAIPLAFALSHGTPGTRKKFVAWNIFGLLDLLVAVSMGILHSGSSLGLLAGSGPTTQLMTELPRSMVPTFLVPMFMLLHMLGLARRNEVVSGALNPVSA